MLVFDTQRVLGQSITKRTQVCLNPIHETYQPKLWKSTCSPHGDRVRPTGALTMDRKTMSTLEGDYAPANST